MVTHIELLLTIKLDDKISLLCILSRREDGDIHCPRRRGIHMADPLRGHSPTDVDPVSRSSLPDGCVPVAGLFPDDCALFVPEEIQESDVDLLAGGSLNTPRGTVSTAACFFRDHVGQCAFWVVHHHCPRGAAVAGTGGDHCW